MEILYEISQNMQIGKANKVKQLIEQALAEGIPPQEILNKGLIDGLNEIGERFKDSEAFIPDVLVAGRTMNFGISVLKPYLVQTNTPIIGRVCIGTIKGDNHDIGKHMVSMMMEARGIEVIDLGTNVSPETFVKTAIEQKCRIICCSALLTTTMGTIADVVAEAKKAGIRDKVKIMIGGAPLSQVFCDKIGADIYTPDAASAADAAEMIFRELII